MKNLEKIIPQNILSDMEETFKIFEINTPLRASHFLAQVMHESADFKFVQENLNYSAVGLSKTWPNKFAKRDKDNKPIKGVPNELALSIQKQPQKIANIAYASRYGNRDEKSGDGWKFRGRGDIQTTFYDNYLALGSYLKVDLISNPDLLTTPKYARLSAGYFWYKNKLNLLADKGSSEEVVKSITKIVNGGFNGLDDRIKRFNKIYNILKD